LIVSRNSRDTLSPSLQQFLAALMPPWAAMLWARRALSWKQKHFTR